MRFHSALALMAVLPAALAGCKAKPGSGAGFADAKLMSNDPSLPFHKVWRKPGVDYSDLPSTGDAAATTSAAPPGDPGVEPSPELGP